MAGTGGKRPGAGRPKGKKNKLALEVRQLEMQGDGSSPLELLLAVMRNPEIPVVLRLEAAKAAAPYLHRKLGPDPAPKEPEAEPITVQAERVFDLPAFMNKFQRANP